MAAQVSTSFGNQLSFNVRVSFMVFSLSVCLSVCYLQNWRFFSRYWLVDFIILSVCLSPTGHNFKPIFMKLQHMVELVITKKPLIFEVKRSAAEVVFLKSSIFIRLTWYLKKIYISGDWIKPANYFGGLRQLKGQHRPNFLNCQFSFDWLEIWRSCIFGH